MVYNEKLATITDVNNVVKDVDTVNDAANAIKATVSGSTIWIKDISPIKHVINTKIKRRNLYNHSVTVAEEPENGGMGYIQNGHVVIETSTMNVGEKGRFYTEIPFKNVCSDIEIGKTYTWDCLIYNGLDVNYLYDDGVFDAFIQFADGTVWKKGESVCITEELLNSTLTFGCEIIATQAEGTYCWISEIAICEGDSAVYADYVEDLTSIEVKVFDGYGDLIGSFFSNADGSVEGIMSEYDGHEGITLASYMEDEFSESVYMVCEYNQDINKAIDDVKDDIQILDNVTAELSTNIEDITKLPEFELINKITVEPDTDGSLPAWVYFTTDSDGNPFELTDFYVNIAGGFSTTANFYAQVNESNRSVLVNANVSFTSDTLRKTIFRCRQCVDGYIEYTVNGSCAPASGTYWNPQLSTSRVVLVSPQDREYYASARKVGLGTSGATWIEGSTFELWGVRK